MRFYSVTDRGILRETNEDSCYTGEINGYNLFVLADGMGGHRGGKAASSKAIETIVSMAKERLKPQMIPGQIMLFLSEVIENANAEIVSMAQSDSDLVGMGTTCDICLVLKNTAYVAHIGDSRVYKISKDDNSITKITKDHSLVEYMIETGTITREEALHHPQKNIILQALGTSSEIDADVFQTKIASGDILLMCSDGLTNMVEEKEIADVILSMSDPEKSANELVRLANKAGGTDNITVVIAMN